MTSIRTIGGFHVPADKRLSLFRVTIPTSIEDLEDYVLAKDKGVVEQWLKDTHPHGFAKGYEPIIKRLDGNMLGNIHILSDDPSILYFDSPEIL